MVFGIDFPNDTLNCTIGIDHECGAVDTVVLATHKFFFAPHAVSQRHSMVFVGQQVKRQLVFFLKFNVFFNGVGADAENFESFCLKLRIAVAQAARFGCTTGSVVFRVKI